MLLTFLIFPMTIFCERVGSDKINGDKPSAFGAAPATCTICVCRYVTHQTLARLGEGGCQKVGRLRVTLGRDDTGRLHLLSLLHQEPGTSDSCSIHNLETEVWTKKKHGVRYPTIYRYVREMHKKNTSEQFLIFIFWCATSVPHDGCSY